MPFYEYQCASCGHHLEAMQKISDAPLKKCPECGRNQLRRLISAPVFRLKGAGWYETDFKGDKDSRRNLAGSDDEAPRDATAGEAKAEGKGADAKPEAGKAEGKTEGKAGAVADKPAAAPAKSAPRQRAASPGGGRARSAAKPASSARRAPVRKK